MINRPRLRLTCTIGQQAKHCVLLRGEGEAGDRRFRIFSIHGIQRTISDWLADRYGGQPANR